MATTNIKTMKELIDTTAAPTGNNLQTFYPKTHEKAVVDDNGNTLDSKLADIIEDAEDAATAAANVVKAQCEEIKAQTEAIKTQTEAVLDNGAVRTDVAQSLSDTQKAQALANVGISGIDDEPTAGSDNLVKSGGVQNELALGAVYDVSAKNPTAGPNNDGKFTSLSALLSDANLNTIIPPTVRKGGMSIKFIQSSDNKYVQFRYMGTATTGSPNPFTNTANWQGVANGITAGSKDLATSGAVNTAINSLSEKVVKEANDTDNLLSVCDKDGNIIVKVNSGFEVDDEGNIKTAAFDSEEILDEDDVNSLIDENIKSDSVGKSDDEGNDLSLSDGDGNIIAGFKDGNFKTKNFDSTLILSSAKSSFPKLDVNKTQFKWLDIGNSHSLCSLSYLKRIAISQEVDLSNVAFCRVARGGSSFKSWVEGYHDEDTSGSGDQLTGGLYNLYKDFGGISVKVTGNTYTEVNGTPTPVVDHELSETVTRFWGGDCSILRSLLADNKFDLITIHQRYVSNPKYDESDRWRDHSDDGYLTEFIRIIKTTQPQASVGYLFALNPFGTYGGTTLAEMNNTFKRYTLTIRKFMADTGVDIVLPCDTALENLRNSSVPNEVIEGSSPEVDGNVVSRYGFCYDTAHTAFGVAAYTMSCAAWEMILARRYGKSMYGNTYRELKSDDVAYTPTGSNTTQKRLRGSYTDSNGDKVMIDANGAYNTNEYIGCTSSDGGVTWNYNDRSKATIRVSDDNAELCQMSAILAVNDMWDINNPDGVEI